MLVAAVQHLGAALHHDPAEPAPVLVVAIRDERDERVLANVGYAFQAHRRASLRLLVDGEVQSVPVDDEADGYHVRMTGGIGRREARNPLRF